MKRVLFLCTGNSCRSQMAEAIVNARLGSQWEAVSAGTKPAGYIHPKALEALSEIGIKHDGSSKRADEFRGTEFDLVVTVCDSAAEECPVWLGKGKLSITVSSTQPRPMTWKIFAACVMRSRRSSRKFWSRLSINPLC